MRGVFARTFIAVAVLAPMSSGAEEVPAREVPLTLHRSGHVTVRVTAGGVGPFRFLVDTGSSASSVFEHLANRLQLVAAWRTEVVAAVGTELRGVAPLGPLRVGQVEVPDIHATLLTHQERRNVGLDVDGILGQDFLARFHYTIDYRKGRLIWEDAPERGDTRPEDTPLASTRVRLIASGGRSVIELPQGIAGEPPLRFVPDTGASTLVVFERSSALPVAIIADHRSAEAASLLATRKTKMMRLLELKVGDLTLRNQPAVILTRSIDEFDVDGLLPLHMFSRVSFRHRDGVLILSR